MADINKTVAVIFTTEDKLSQAVQNVEKALKELDKAAKEAGASGDDLAELFGDKSRLKFDKVADQASELVTALKALGAGLVINAFIDANVEAEKFERTMRLLTGTNEAAAKEFDYVRSVANTLGAELFTTGNAYAQLAAATKGSALEGQATRDIFEAVSRAMSSLGKSSADTEGALLAISQIVSKGNVSLEELRGQLGERLPGAFTLAAKSMGLTTQELDKLVSSGNLTAAEFLPKFTQAINEAFGGATFDGYTANLNRLKNAISEAFITIGDAGAFAILTKAVEGSGKGVASFVGGLEYLGGVFSATTKLFTTGDIETFNRDLRQVEAQFNLTADKIGGITNETAAETARLSRQAAEAGLAIGTNVAKGAELSGDAWKKAAGEIDKSLKALGIDPKIFQDPVKEIEKAFTDLANNPVLKGDQLFAGLVGALRSLPQDANLEVFRQQIAYAFRDGKISADQLAQALALLEVKQKGLSPSFAPVTEASKAQAEALDKQAKAAKKAEEDTQKYRLELEKLASNERIKLIEARVTLDVANLEEQTKRVEAAFESIDNTVNSTGDLIGKLFGNFSDDLSFRDLSLLRDQIEDENRRRDDALRLQTKLVEAQIEQIKASTQKMLDGDALIKIDALGLEPHLEAFMWQILKKVQVRVNEQGMSMLLGV